MSGWQDDLPPIAADRMLSNVVHEGRRRIERRQQRRRWAVAGLGTTVALVAIFGAASQLGNDAQFDGDDAATEATDAAADTFAPAATEPAATIGGATEETTTATEAEGTIPPAGTEAPAATTAGTAAGTTAPPVVPGTPIETGGVELDPLNIWTLPDDGPSCGVSTVAVHYVPDDDTLQRATVVWTGPFGTAQLPMQIDGNVAAATIGPFPRSVIGSSSERVFVMVVAVEVDGSVRLVEAPEPAFRLTPC